MANTILVGLQWGDEGKGKVIDFLTEKCDAVVRFQGGNNAGHTVEIGDEKFVLHLIPSGILRKDKLCVIGNGVVVNPYSLYEEVEALRKRGFDVRKQLQVSDRCQLVFSYHCLLDGLSEQNLGERKIGTTKRGIGPAYSDKVNRSGIRAGELLNPSQFEKHFRSQLNEANKQLIAAGTPPIDSDQELAKLKPALELTTSLVKDTVYSVNQIIKNKGSVLFEGAQGTWLDVDFGTYPFVTSSNTTVGGACTGAGVSPVHMQDIIGIAKAYTTRVGSGPFPTELFDETGKHLAKIGNEFGATTGRPRRCGWFDAVATRYATMINGVNKLVVTKLDVLDQLETIKICTAYNIDGKITKIMPSDSTLLEKIVPIYEEMPGWQQSTENIKCWDELPQAAKNYLNRLTELIESELYIVSIGPKRCQTFILGE